MQLNVFWMAACYFPGSMLITAFLGACLVTQSCLTLCDPMDYRACQAPLSIAFSRQENGVVCHALLWGIFPAQGSNPRLLYLLNREVGSLLLALPGNPTFLGRHIHVSPLCAPLIHGLPWTAFKIEHMCISFSFCIFKNIYLFMAMLGLCCWSWTFSSYGKRILLPSFSAWASHCTGLRCGTQASGVWALVVVMHGLDCFTGYGIFLDQESNPCLLHWQVDS